PTAVPSYLMLFLLRHPATTRTLTLSLHTLFRSLSTQPQRRTRPSGVSRSLKIGFNPSPASAAARLYICSQLPRPRRTSFSDTSKDRKSTRLNSSHVKISYAVFCLKNKPTPQTRP